MTDVTEPPQVRTTPHTRTASYLAEPDEVSKVLLLYSGGLDTSVMLKWIQDEYDAEVIALCIDLGQPDDDFEAVRRKALDLGAEGRELSLPDVERLHSMKTGALIRASVLMAARCCPTLGGAARSEVGIRADRGTA